MATFSAPDGTRLSYRVSGEGSPLICLPGGMLQDAGYLGELGGLSAHRQLIMLDPRGTGGSAIPRDPASYRCDRLVDDVEALREHLGLDRLDLLGHSAGTNLATLYAARHPERIAKLALIAPAGRAVGITITGETRLETARLRKDEPWFPPAFAALEAIVAGIATETSWQAIDPFSYGRWDEAARTHHADQDSHRNDDAAPYFGQEGVFHPDTTRAALTALNAPVLLFAGEFDLNSPPSTVAEVAALFPHGDLVVQPAAGHFPWLDDATSFVTTTASFLGQPG